MTALTHPLLDAYEVSSLDLMGASPARIGYETYRARFSAAREALIAALDAGAAQAEHGEAAVLACAKRIFLAHTRRLGPATTWGADEAWDLGQKVDVDHVAKWTELARAALAAPAEPQTGEVVALKAALEPFGLISSEGVIRAKEGHVTVTTCAEYFHRAAALLASPKAPQHVQKMHELGELSGNSGQLVEKTAKVSDLVAAVTEFMPSTGLALDNRNIPDSQVLPLDVTMGELRKIADALSALKATGESDV